MVSLQLPSSRAWGRTLLSRPHLSPVMLSFMLRFQIFILEDHSMFIT